MDDWQMARLTIDAVRTAARLAEQEQRRRRRKQEQALKAAAAQNRGAAGQSQDEAKSQGEGRGQGQGEDQAQGQGQGQGERRIPQPAKNVGGDGRSASRRQPEFEMPGNADEIPEEFLPRM